MIHLHYSRTRIEHQNMQQRQWTRYQASVQSVIDYIHDNPQGPVDNDTLSSIACLSTYHWHRIYQGITGESAVQTVRKVRMNIAAAELIRTTSPIADIGRSVGYPSVQSFTRAFKSHYAQTPGDFRKTFHKPPLIDASHKLSKQGYEVELVEQPSLRLIGLHHQGDYQGVGRSFAKVFAANIGVGDADTLPIGVGVYFQDPASFEDQSLLTSFVGVQVNQDTQVPEGFVDYTITASLCAVTTYKGPHASLELPYFWMFGEWLPNSNMELADQAAYEIYTNSPAEVAPEDLVTKVCLPVV